MALNERQNDVLKILKEKKTATVTQLSKLLYVSEATLRRDLKAMQAMGLVERTHGGARLRENVDEISLFFRMEKNAEQKQKAAFAALRRLPTFHCVFIDSSSTALALAQRLDLRGKTVVTNGLQTALVLSKKENVNVLLLGGTIQPAALSATGSLSTRLIAEFSFDLCICSCAAIAGSSAYERSIEQAELKRAALSVSTHAVLLADSSKFFASAPYRTAELSRFDFVATDAPPQTVLESVTFIYENNPTR